MGLAESGARASDAEDDDDSDSNDSPIEMTLVNRKQKDGLRKKRTRARKNSDTGNDGDSKKLQLFENDEEEGGPRRDP